MIHFKQKNNVYLCWGLTAFFTVFAILAAYDIFLGSHMFIRYADTLTAILTPIVLGCSIAYLLLPTVNFLEHRVLFRWASPGFASRKPVGWVRVISILLTFLMVFGIFILLMRFLLPNVWASIIKLAENIPVYINAITDLLENLGGSLTLTPEMYTYVMSLYTKGMETLYELTSSGAPSFLAKISGGIFGVLGFFTNLIVGFVIAAYVLGMKERLGAQSKKLACALFEASFVDKLLDAVRYTDHVLGGFIRGSIVDSAIVGVICFLAFQIMGIPYAPLLSVLIGITNIIPFFGPFLGAIPSCLLIFLVSPLQCLEFIIFIVILQQLEGNIIAPKVLGHTTGLSSLWVVVSVLVCGGLFGPLGMLFGCPVFALFFALFRLIINKNLEKKHMPTETDLYRQDGIPHPGISSPHPD